jgi:4-amino-4-deoxy-L-arabinose transferase-like glycosyltransferase
VAFATRVAVAIYGRDLQLAPDPHDYLRHAASIANGHGYPDTLLAAPGSPSALRPPAFPYLLGATQAVVGHPRASALLLEAVLGTVAVWLVWFIANELWGARAGLVAGAAAALFPPLVLLNAVPLSETLFIPLELAIVALVLVARRREAPPYTLAAACGVACGLAALGRQTGLLLVLAVVAGLLMRPGWERRRALAASALAVVAMLVVVAPWTARNAHEFHRFIPVALQDGVLLAGIYNDTSAHLPGRHAVWIPPQFLAQFHAFYNHPGIDEGDLNERLSSAGKRYIREHPAYLLEASGLAVLRMAGVGPGSSKVNRSSFFEMGTPSSLRTVSRFSGLLLAVAALAAAAVLALRRRGPIFVWLVPLLMLLATAPLAGTPRYRSTLDAFLILLVVGAIYSTAWASSRVANSRTRAAAPPGPSS